MTKNEVLAVIGTINAAYPHNRLTDSTVVVWLRTLEGDSYEAIGQAAKVWIGAERWPPTVADLRNLARQAAQRERQGRPQLPTGARLASRDQSLDEIAAARRRLREQHPSIPRPKPDASKVTEAPPVPKRSGTPGSE